MLSYSEWIVAVAQVGFPIVVALYVLIRLNGRLDALTEAVVNLRETMLRIYLSRGHGESENE